MTYLLLSSLYRCHVPTEEDNSLLHSHHSYRVGPPAPKYSKIPWGSAIHYLYPRGKGKIESPLSMITLHKITLVHQTPLIINHLIMINHQILTITKLYTTLTHYQTHDYLQTTLSLTLFSRSTPPHPTLSQPWTLTPELNDPIVLTICYGLQKFSYYDTIRHSTGSSGPLHNK